MTYSHEEVVAHVERVVRKVVPDVTTLFKRQIVESIIELIDGVRDEIYNGAGENGQLDEDGELVGNALLAKATVDALGHMVINRIMDSKVKVVTSLEEAEFYKSLGDIELGGET